jgi:hypothetical protein
MLLPSSRGCYIMLLLQGSNAYRPVHGHLVRVHVRIGQLAPPSLSHMLPSYKCAPSPAYHVPALFAHFVLPQKALEHPLELLLS